MKKQLPPLQQKFNGFLRELLKADAQEALAAIRSFRKRHESDPYFSQISKVMASKEALYLAELGEAEGALAIFQALLEEELRQEKPDSYAIGVNYLSILKVLRETGRPEKAKDLAAQALQQYSFDWGVNIALLHTILLVERQADLAPYREKIGEIERELRLELDLAMPLNAQLWELQSENRRANLAYTKMILGDFDQEELVRQLQEFEQGEKVGFYRDLARVIPKISN